MDSSCLIQLFNRMWVRFCLDKSQSSRIFQSSKQAFVFGWQIGKGGQNARRTGQQRQWYIGWNKRETQVLDRDLWQQVDI